MGRTVNRTYIAPIEDDGTPVEPGSESTFENARGVYTLEANSTYYFILPLGGSTMIDVHLTHDAEIVITLAQLETCSHAKSDVSDSHAEGDGSWIAQDPPSAYVAVAGADTSATGAIVAVAGGTAGGASWQGSDVASERARLAVATGASGGEVRVSLCGKD